MPADGTVSQDTASSLITLDGTPAFKPPPFKHFEISDEELRKLVDVPENRSYVNFKTSQTPEADGNVIEEYDKRGTSLKQGTAYHDTLDIERFHSAAHIALSYQIASVNSLDSVAETFAVVMDFNLQFEINDSDVDHYNEYKDQGNVTFQTMTDDKSIKAKPPIIEIRNSVEKPEYSSERVTGLQQCWNHRKKRWAWYVTLYTQLRVTCFEEFEMERFPFTRNSLQVHMQCKLPMAAVLLVPANARSAVPHYCWNPATQKVSPTYARGNTFKTDRTTGSWAVINHHVAFVPWRDSYPMPSGAYFSACLVTIQIEQRATFFLWNTVGVLVLLPVLSAGAVLQDIGDVADRMSIILALLLTMATYMVSINAWIPQKEYLTFMDWYILAGYGWILMMGLVIGIACIYHRYTAPEEPEEGGEDDLLLSNVMSLGWGMGRGLMGAVDMNAFGDEDNESGNMTTTAVAEEVCDPLRLRRTGCESDIEVVESRIVLALSVIWLLLHFLALCFRDWLYLPWGDVMAVENEDTRRIKRNVTAEFDWVQKVKATVEEEAKTVGEYPKKALEAGPIMHKLVVNKPAITPEEQSVQEAQEMVSKATAAA